MAFSKFKTPCPVVLWHLNLTSFNLKNPGQLNSKLGLTLFSKAAAAVTILKTEPTEWFKKLLFKRGKSSFFRLFSTALGLKEGKLEIAKISPVLAFKTTPAPFFIFVLASVFKIYCTLELIVSTTPSFFSPVVFKLNWVGFKIFCLAFVWKTASSLKE